MKEIEALGRRGVRTRGRRRRRRGGRGRRSAGRGSARRAGHPGQQRRRRRDRPDHRPHAWPISIACSRSTSAGVYAATQAAVPLLSDGGRVIHLGSCAAGRVTSPGMTLYAMSKAALVGLSKGLARELGAARHHLERRPARPDRHRHEPGRRPVRGGPDRATSPSIASARPPRWPPPITYLAGPSGRLHHRHRTDDRRRPHRLTACGKNSSPADDLLPQGGAGCVSVGLARVAA